MKPHNSCKVVYAPGSAARSAAALLILALLCLSGVATEAFGVDGTLIWQAQDSLAGKQEARAAAVDSQGNVIVTGYQTSSGSDDYWTVKFKGDGSGVAWRASYDKAGGSDQATAVVVDHHDDVIVSGYVWNGSNRDIHTIKYSGSDGSVIWQHTFNGDAGGNDMATAIAVDSMNNVYVGGSSQGASGTDDYVVIRYAASGPVGNLPAWHVTYNGPANNMDSLYGLAAGSTGIAVTGQSYNGTAFDMLSVKYDFNGNKLWEKRYASAGGAAGKKVGMDADGNVIVTGYAADSSSKNVYTAKYGSSDGTLLWERSYATPFDEEANDLYVDTAGDVFVTGYVYTLNGTKKRAYTARYGSSSGAAVWESISALASDSDEGTGIVVDSVGDAYITGVTISALNYDIFTTKYKRANGTELWSHRFNGSVNLNDRPVGIGLAGDGAILVAGWTDAGSNGFDYVTMKLDPQYLSAPSNLMATTLSGSSIRLTWTDNAGNEDGYKIERKIGEGGVYAQVAQLGANVTSYDDLGLSGNLTYYYRVRAYNGSNGDSRYSNDAHALTVYFTDVSPAWTYLYNSADNLSDSINAIAVGPDNNPVVTGFSQKNAGGHNYLTIKLDSASKNVLWSQPYDDPNGGTDEAMCVAVDSGNNAIVSGFATLYSAQTHADIFSIYTLMYAFIDPSSVSWDSQYNGPANIDDRPVAIASASDSSNNTAVVGYGRNAANNTDIYLLKYNSATGKVWSAIPIDGPGHGNDIPSAAAFAPDGSIYVTGYSETSPGSGTYGFFTAKFNGNDGSLIWSDVYSVVPNGDNRGNGIAVDASGDVYVSGTATTGSGNKDMYIIKYSGTAATPQRLWEHALDGRAHGDDNGLGIGIDRLDGSIIVAGTSLTSTGNGDFTLIKYSASGDVQWQQILLRPDHDDTVTGMAVDPSGTIYLTGTTSNGANPDILSAIIDPSGAILAVSTYNGPGNDADEAAAIVANEKGEAFAAGYTTNASGNMDYVVLKLLSTSYILPVPTHLAAVPQTDSGRINLSWTNNYQGAAFHIERTIGPATAGSSWSLASNAPVGTTSFQDSGLLPSTSYCYRMDAYSGSMTSRKTVPVCTSTTPAQPVLNQPAILSATAIDLSWGNVAGNTGYKLERSTDAATWAQIGGNLAADTTTYHDTGLAAGSSYAYRITALSSVGPSRTSAIQIVPGLSAATASTSEIDLSWPVLSGISGFRLERSSDGTTGWTQIATPLASATSYQNTGLSAGTIYYYRIKAVTADGDSVPSSVIAAGTYLPTPTIQTLTADSTSQLTVTWSAVAGATGYTVRITKCNYTSYNASYCSNYAAYSWAFNGWTTAATNVTGNSYAITGLTPGTSYTVALTATAPGTTSQQSNLLSRWTLLAPISLALSTPSGSSVRLDWNQISGVTTNYTVQRSADGSSWGTIGSSGSVNYYTDSTVTTSTTYYYRVSGSGAEMTVTSNQASITTPPGGPTLNAPAVVPPAEIDLAWSRVAGNIGYEVQRSLASSLNFPTSPSFTTWNTIVTTAQNTESYNDTGLTAGYTYGYRVRAILAGGGYTDWSATTGTYYATTTPPVPGYIYAAGQNATSTTLYWGDVYGDNGYDTQYKIQSGGDCANGAWTAGPSTSQNYYYTTITGLTNDTTNTYCFQVRAKINGLYSGWSSTAVMLPSPAAPTFGAITASSVVVNWGQVTGNSGYRLERSPDNTNWSLLATLGANTTTYTNTGLTAGVSYYYRVRTLNGSNASSPGASASATTMAVAAPTLNAPSGITSSSITLSWNDVAGNNGYRVQRSPDNTTWSTVTPDIGQSVATFTDTGLTSGTTYYYRIYTKYGTSSLSASPSNVQSAKTLLASPGTPSLAIISESRIDVTWQLTAGATNYKLQQSIGPDGPWSQITNPSLAFVQKYCGLYSSPSTGCPTLVPAYTTYTNSGLAADTTYCYQIISADADPADDSAPSAVVCGKTPAVAAPTLLEVSNPPAKRTIQLSWSYDGTACSPACGQPDGYEIWRQAWNGEWGLLARTAGTTYTDRVNIDSQKTFTYKIRAYKGADTSVFSNSKATTTAELDPTSTSCP